MIREKRVLFLYPNRPENLPINMITMLNNTESYGVQLVYLDRTDSPACIPMTGLLNEERCFSIRWPVGKNIFTKIINRIIILGFFVRKIRKLQPDVIHAWNLDMLLAARLAAKRLPNTKVVFTLQDTTRWMLSGLVKKLQRWAYKGVDLFYVTSKQFESRYLRRFGLISDDTEVVYIPNVPVSSMFADFRPREIRARLVVGYIGMLRGTEGIKSLVKAVQLARNNGIDIRVLFAGTGVGRNLVAKLSRKHGDFITHEGPYRHDRDILDLYSRVDVLYAIYDDSYDKQIHLAYRLCEAINCHLPTIVATGTNMAKIVNEHGVGISVRLGDVNELTAALMDLCRDQEKRKMIASNCEAIRCEFEFEYYEAKIRAAYAGLWNSDPS